MEAIDVDRMSSEHRWVLRLGGMAAVIGSVLGMVGNLAHPATPIGDRQGVAAVIALSDAWVPTHLAIVVGIALMVGGLVALGREIRGGAAGALARMGVAAAVVGGTIGLVLVILDGVAARQLAQEWLSSPPGRSATALSLVHVNETINFALASLFNLTFAAATFVLFGLAVVLSGRFRPWVGWVAVAAGVLSAAAGTIQATIGEPTDASFALTIVGPTVITAWLLGMGVALVRRAGGRPAAVVDGEAKLAA